MVTDTAILKENITLARSGDSAGLEWLFYHYSPRLFGYFLHSTGNVHEAEDLLGELWVRLIKNIERYDPRGRFEQWLFRIAANLARDRIRRLKAGPSKLSIDAHSEGHGRYELPHLKMPDVDKAMIDSENREQLMAALDQLDETTRSMILLRHYSQASFAEIAQQFECPMGTALAKVHRGLKKLKKIMSR